MATLPSLARKDEVTILINNIPPQTRTIFIPLKISPEHITFERLKLRDSLLHSYLTQIEKNEDGEMLGLSIARANKTDLPQSLEIRTRITNHSKLKTETANLFLSSPFIYTKFGKPIQGAFAGFDKITLLDYKQKDRLEDSSGAFRVRSMDQTIFKSIRRKKTLPTDVQLRSLQLMVSIPKGEKLNRLFIPLKISHIEAIKFRLLDVKWAGKVAMRAHEDYLEIISTDAAYLPTDTPLRFHLQLASPLMGSGDIALAEVLREPSRVLPGVQVSITPGSLILNPDFDLGKVFEID